MVALFISTYPEANIVFAHSNCSVNIDWMDDWSSLPIELRPNFLPEFFILTQLFF